MRMRRTIRKDMLSEAIGAIDKLIRESGSGKRNSRFVAVFDGMDLERESVAADGEYRSVGLGVSAKAPFDRLYVDGERELTEKLREVCRKDGYDTFGELGLQWNGGGDYYYVWVTADKEGRKPWTRELENRKGRGEIPSYIHGVNILVYRNDGGEPTGEPTDF